MAMEVDQPVVAADARSLAVPLTSSSWLPPPTSPLRRTSSARTTAFDSSPDPECERGLRRSVSWRRSSDFSIGFLPARRPSRSRARPGSGRRRSVDAPRRKCPRFGCSRALRASSRRSWPTRRSATCSTKSPMKPGRASGSTAARARQALLRVEVDEGDRPPRGVGRVPHRTSAPCPRAAAADCDRRLPVARSLVLARIAVRASVGSRPSSSGLRSPTATWRRSRLRSCSGGSPPSTSSSERSTSGAIERSAPRSLRHKPLPADSRRVIEAAAGNPFFALELAAAVLRREAPLRPTERCPSRTGFVSSSAPPGDAAGGRARALLVVAASSQPTVAQAEADRSTHPARADRRGRSGRTAPGRARKAPLRAPTNRIGRLRGVAGSAAAGRAPASRHPDD